MEEIHACGGGMEQPSAWHGAWSVCGVRDEREERLAGGGGMEQPSAWHGAWSVCVVWGEMGESCIWWGVGAALGVAQDPECVR